MNTTVLESHEVEAIANIASRINKILVTALLDVSEREIHPDILNKEYNLNRDLAMTREEQSELFASLEDEYNSLIIPEERQEKLTDKCNIVFFILAYC